MSLPGQNYFQHLNAAISARLIDQLLSLFLPLMCFIGAGWKIKKRELRFLKTPRKKS